MPFLAHATMEPVNCTVHVRPEGCDIWVGTQVPTFAQTAAAKVTALPPQKVQVHNQLLGGGFGRRLEVDLIVRAVEIAKQVASPVKVVWTYPLCDYRRAKPVPTLELLCSFGSPGRIRRPQIAHSGVR